MNAPIFPNRRSPPGEAEIDRLVDRHLAHETRREAVLRAHAEPGLARFLRLVRRRRRARMLRRLLPVPTFFRVERHGHVRSAAAPHDAAPSPVRMLVPDWNGLRRLGVIAALALTLLAVLPMLAEMAARPFLAHMQRESVEQAMTAMRCGEARLLRDEEGALVGAARLDGGPECSAVQLTAPFDNATASRLAEAIGVLEGRWAPGPLTFFGQDLIGLAHGAFNEIELWLRGLERGKAIAARNRGERPTFFALRGSGPLLSAYEALVGQPNEVGSLPAKLANLRDSMFFEVHALGGDRTARAHFLAERMTVLRIKGRALAGAIGAEFLFGGPPEGLGEVCLFAAAAGFHLYQPYDGASASWNAAVEARLSRARSRARACAEALAESATEASQAHATIARFSPPETSIPGLSANTVRLVDDALGLLAGRDIATPDITLTLDMGAQQEAEASLEEGLARLAPRLAEGLCFSGACARHAYYLIAIAEITGDALPLRLALSNRHHMLFGPYSRDPGGSVTPQAPDFGSGSQHKIPLLLIATRHDESRLCNRHYGDITNTSGPTPVDACAENGAAGSVSTREALGRSMNLPWINLADRRLKEARALESKLGFLGEPAGPGATALGVGRRAPPERFMALMAAIARGAEGGTPATNGLALIAGAPRRAVDLPALGYDATTVAKARALLTAPVAEPYGTLSSLRGSFAGTGCTPQLGKSGTGEIAGTKAARSRSMTVVVTCGTRRFVAFACIDSGHGRTALGAITGRELGRLLADTFKGLS